MAIAAVDEALRNVICVGANPQRTAILDNFCWPKVETEESLGALVRACVGARDAAVAYGLPFISGKDSLNNEFTMSADEATRTGLPERIAIPYTLLISALGIVDDVTRCVTMDLKDPGDCLVLASAPVTPPLVDFLNPRRDREGADNAPPFAAARTLHHRVASLIRDGKVRAAHDVSDGGPAVAIAEMCIASNLGANVTIDPNVTGESIFTPLATTYVLEMAEADADEARLPIIGRVERESRLRIECQSVGTIDLSVDDLGEAWRSPLARGGGR
jgi:phosphoribosylformylglycinamidine synthase